MEPEEVTWGMSERHRVKGLNWREPNGSGSGTYLLQFLETSVMGSVRACLSIREFSIGDVEKSSGLSYTLQMNNPAASQNPGTT